MESKNYNNQLFTKMNRLRNSIIGRCTKPKYDNFRYYGGRGVSISSDWLTSYDKFFQDVTSLPGWDLELFLEGKITLDKDMNKGKVYSKENCVWLTKENNIELKGNNTYYAISPQGEKIIFNIIKKFADEYHLHYSTVAKCLNGSRSNHYVKGWYIPTQKVSNYTKPHKYTPPFYLKDTETLQEYTFSSIKDIADFLGIPSTSISRIRDVINHDKTIKTYKGYLIKDSNTEYKNYVKKSYICYFPDGTTQKFCNLTEFCKSNGFNITCVSECLHKKQDTHKNCKFELIEYEIS